MSIIAAAFTKDLFYIATDTLQSRYDSAGETPFPGIIYGYSTKIAHYPHLKCCVVAIGNSKLSQEHSEFIRSNFFEDIVDLYEATADEFANSVEPSDYPGSDNLIGCIIMLGYSEKEQQMVVLHVNVGRDKVRQANRTTITPLEEGITTFMSPRLSREDEDSAWNAAVSSSGGYEGFLLEVTKKIHANSLSPDTYVFPVGGEINLTKIGVAHGKYFSINTVEHRFSDYHDNALKANHMRLMDSILRYHGKDSYDVSDPLCTETKEYLGKCQEKIDDIQAEIDSLNNLKL